MLRRDDWICQEVSEIASRFGIFDCIPCARSVQSFLISQAIRGRRIQLNTGSQDPIYGRIYDDSIGELIATTGHHEGIAIDIEGQEIVFDNLHPQGLPKAIWLQNFYSPLLDDGGSFEVSETEF